MFAGWLANVHIDICGILRFQGMETQAQYKQNNVGSLSLLEKRGTARA